MHRTLAVLPMAALLLPIAVGQRAVSPELHPETLAMWSGYTLAPPAGPGWKFVSVAEGESIVSRARKLARDRLRNLPNFLCEVTARRLRSRIRSGRVGWFRAMGDILAEARFADGIEQYRVVRVGGKRTERSFHDAGKREGILVSGNEFAGLLRVIFDGSVQFHLDGAATANGRPSHVFRVSVPRSSGFRVQRGGYPGGVVAWQGFVYVDRDSEHVRAIVLESVGIPRSYGILKAYLSVFYGGVRIDGEPHLLPVASESVAFHPGTLPAYRQSSRYRNYRKFEADSELQFEYVESKLSFPRQ